MLQKSGMQSHAHQAVVMPTSHFLTDIQERLALFDAIVHDPDAAAPFPDEHLPLGAKSHSNRLVPGATDSLLDERARVSSRPRPWRPYQTAKREQDQHEHGLAERFLDQIHCGVVGITFCALLGATPSPTVESANGRNYSTESRDCERKQAHLSASKLLKISNEQRPKSPENILTLFYLV